METDLVHGGVCEEMTLKVCITDVGEQVADEIEAFASRVSGWWDKWTDYNDIGIWLYNKTHGC